MANGIRRVVALMPASVLLSLSRSLAAVVGIGIAAAVAPDGWAARRRRGHALFVGRTAGAPAARV
ncbi:hypothetical protein ACX84Q_12305, partial [Burkholderia pseudomallei]